MGKVFHRIRESLFGNGKNWMLFLLSLVIAVLLWMLRNRSRSYSDFVSIPIVAECNIDGHTFESSNFLEITARCKATGYQLGYLNRKADRGKPMHVLFDRKDMHEKDGEFFYVTSDNLQEYSYLIFGESVSVEYFVTDTAMFRFPYENCRKVPVKVVTSIVCRPQYCLTGPVRTDPDSVLVYGNPSYLETIDCVETVPLRYYNLTLPKQGVLNLSVKPGVRVSAETVNYSISVGRYVEYSKNIPVKTENVPHGKHLHVVPSSVSVTFHCVYPYHLDILEDVEAVIDYQDFLKSLKGSCIPKMRNLPGVVISCSTSPQLCECALSDE